LQQQSQGESTFSSSRGSLFVEGEGKKTREKKGGLHSPQEGLRARLKKGPKEGGEQIVAGMEKGKKERKHKKKKRKKLRCYSLLNRGTHLMTASSLKTSKRSGRWGQGEKRGVWRKGATREVELKKKGKGQRWKSAAKGT